MMKRSVLQYHHIFIILLFHNPNVLHRYIIDILAGLGFSLLLFYLAPQRTFPCQKRLLFSKTGLNRQILQTDKTTE